MNKKQSSSKVAAKAPEELKTSKGTKGQKTVADADLAPVKAKIKAKK